MSIKPLVCTQNSQSHVDYGIPIFATRSTDYRTSTGTYHRNIPNIPQNFDCRVRAKIKAGLSRKDVALKEDVVSTYGKDYSIKFNGDIITEVCDRSVGSGRVHGIREVEENYKKTVPSFLIPPISLMKDSYRNRPSYREITKSAVPGICTISGLFKPMQHRLAPEQHGSWKHLDIYLTENKLQYVPYSKDQMENATKRNPRQYFESLPLVKPPVLPNKFLSRGQKHVPHLGMQSEFQAKYKHQICSNLYPYLQEHGVEFKDSLADAGPWQNLSAPGMYCTENSHIATGWPVRAVVDIGKSMP